MNMITDPVLQTGAYPEVSPKYKFTSTKEIKQYLLDRGFVVFKETATRARKNLGYQKHCIKFVPSEYARFLPSEDPGQHVVHRDAPTVPMLILTNSHDGKSAFVLHGGFFRVLCANGLVVSDGAMEPIRIRHNTNNIMEKIYDATWKIVAELDKQMQRIELMKAKKLNATERFNLANAALTLVPNAAQLNPLDALVPQRPGDEGDDLWTVFNRVQEHIIKGGLKREGGRRTREVRNLKREIDLNQQLWDVAEEFLRAA